MRDVTAALRGLLRPRREARAAPDVPWSRREPKYCAGCKRSAPPYVYLQNRKDYCVPCARRLVWLFGIKPAGQRKEDLTLEDLMRSDDEQWDRPARAS